MSLFRQCVFYIIIINVIFFAIGILYDFKEIESLALYFPLNDKFKFWQFFTYMFMHGSLMHILFNMIALSSFGSVLESTYKAWRFLLFYIATALGAAIIYMGVKYYQFTGIINQITDLGYSAESIQTFLNSGLVDPNLVNNLGEEKLLKIMDIYNTPVVGASGAIYGVIVAFAFANPNAKLSLIFLPIPIKAKYFVPILISGDLFFALTKYSIGNIAHFAHIGGAFSALCIVLIYIYFQKHIGSKKV